MDRWDQETSVWLVVCSGLDQEDKQKEKKKEKRKKGAVCGFLCCAQGCLGLGTMRVGEYSTHGWVSLRRKGLGFGDSALSNRRGTLFSRPFREGLLN